MESTAITFDQLPHVLGGLSEKLDRVLELLEKVGIAYPFNHHKPKRRIVYTKEARQHNPRHTTPRHCLLKRTSRLPQHRPIR